MKSKSMYPRAITLSYVFLLEFFSGSGWFQWGGQFLSVRMMVVDINLNINIRELVFRRHAI